MLGRVRARPFGWLVAVCAVVAVAALGLSASALARSGAKCGTIVLDENAWSGATANVYVMKYVLEKNFGCKIDIAKLPESTPLFQAMADGKVDVVLEDWENIKLAANRHYVTKQKAIVELGPSGIEGPIGWYIPRYLLKQYPQFATWKGLKGKESIFKSPESGSQGMFLGGDPSYVQKDQQLIQALGLNLKFVSVGAEPAQVARWTQLYKQKKPVLFYWYEPQYLNAPVGPYDLVQVKLPPRFPGCKDTVTKPVGPLNLYRCAYHTFVIDKLYTTKFATSGSPAVAVIKRWHWADADQEQVAKWIAGDHMDPDKAAEKWVKANPTKVNAWLK